MPVERRKRVTRHEKLSRPEQRQAASQDDAFPQHLELGSTEQSSGYQIVGSSSEPGHLKKKVKQQIRHEALLEKLGVNSSPYSKSHAKRLKRRAREELSTSLTAIGDAIAAVDSQDASSHHPTRKADGDVAVIGTSSHTSQIGEGKARSLTKNQRKRTLKAEKFRHTLIIDDGNFANNPFSTIRTHAKNTLVEHQL